MIVFIEFIATLVSAVIGVVIGCIFKRARKALLIVSFCMVVVFLASAPHITYNNSENDLIEKFAQNDWSNKEKLKEEGYIFDENNDASFSIDEGEDGFYICVCYNRDRIKMFYDNCNIVKENYRYYCDEVNYLNWFYLPYRSNIHLTIVIDDDIAVIAYSQGEFGKDNPLYEYMENTHF